MNDGSLRDPAAYSVVDGDVGRDRAKVIDVWRGNLGWGDRLDAKYDWFYSGCPWGEPMLQLLRHERMSEWVGVAAIGPRRMLWHGKEIRAGVLVDLAVASRHRSLGPALMLQRATLNRAMEQFDLVYGFPNPKAMPVVKRVGYSELGQIVRYSRVLRHGPYLQRLMFRPVARAAGAVLDALDRMVERVRSTHSRLVGEWRDEVDPRMQELWMRSTPGDGLVSMRDCASVRWRFNQAGFMKTRYLLVGAQSGGAIDAWFACQSENSTLHVRDFWSSDAPRGVSPAAIRALVRAARAQGYAAVSVQHAGSREAVAAWRAARFVERERRPIIGACRPSIGRDASALCLHLTPADEDE